MMKIKGILSRITSEGWTKNINTMPEAHYIGLY